MGWASMIQSKYTSAPSRMLSGINEAPSIIFASGLSEKLYLVVCIYIKHQIVQIAMHLSFYSQCTSIVTPSTILSWRRIWFSARHDKYLPLSSLVTLSESRLVVVFPSLEVCKYNNEKTIIFRPLYRLSLIHCLGTWLIYF